MLFVVKGFMPMKMVELIWLQRLAYRLCPHVILPSMKSFVEDILLGLVDKKHYLLMWNLHWLIV
jgi:hypothetical protein